MKNNEYSSNHFYFPLYTNIEVIVMVYEYLATEETYNGKAYYGQSF